MSLTYLSLAGNIIAARAREVSDNPAGDGKIDNLFLQCKNIAKQGVFLTLHWKYYSGGQLNCSITFSGP
jgi:hypothetical protein